MATTVTKHQNFIGGEWVDAAGGETMEVLNPATGETIAEVPDASAEDVDRAVQSAKQALPEWLETTPAERATMLLKLADAIDQHADELAELEVDTLEVVGGGARDDLAGLDVAGERYEADVGVLHDRLAGGNAVAGDDVQDARRQDVGRELREAERGERRLLGGLEHLDVSGRERR